MLKIYHNPRCRKSREALQLLESSKHNFDVRLYLNTPLSEDELTALIAKLNIKPIQLVRTGEAIWKEQFKGKTLSNAALIKAMVNNPKLIERPIIENKANATIGRPLENVRVFLENLRH